MTTQTDKDRVIRQMMQDFPEASSQSLICTKYNYKDMVFEFGEDDEKHKELIRHLVNMKSLRKGFDKLLNLALEGQYKNYGFPSGIFGDNPDWDATDVEALAQCAIFGEIIYG